MTDLVNALAAFEVKLDGEFKKSTSQLKSEQKKEAGRVVPKKRLTSEVSDITVKIATAKEDIQKLRESKVSTEDTGAEKNKAAVLELEQVVRERLAQERLLESLKVSIARLSKELNDTQESLEGLEGESQSMNGYFNKMETEATELKAQLAKEKEQLVVLEKEEQDLLTQQDAVQGEHTTKLQDQEAILGAMRELGDMRDGHAASLKGLRQMAKDDVKLSTLVEEELARIEAQTKDSEPKEKEAAEAREAILHAIKESESQFVDSLKEVRSKINAQNTTISRMTEFFTKVTRLTQA